MKLKKGVKFAPPVNREIQAKDIKYAFERAFTKNVPNQYTTYFNFIEGVPEEAAGKLQGHLGHRGRPGDPYKITFKLDASRRASGFAAFLVMPVTTPVPKEYAEKFDKESPSTYNENVVSSGPYMVENDAEGKLIGCKAGKSIQLVRNPNWDAEQGLPSRVPRRDPAAHERDRRQRRPAARCSRARTWSSTPTRRRRCSSASCSARRTSS